MKSRNASLLLATCLLLFSGLAQADLFASAFIGTGYGDMSSEVKFTPAHPVSSTTVGDADDGASTTSAFIGWRWPSRWYVKAGYADLGAFERFKSFGGSDGTSNFSTFASREESVTTGVLLVGTSFGVAKDVNLYAQAGVHRYALEATETARTTETVIATGASTATTSQATEKARDTAAVFGVGLEFEVSRPITVLFGLSHYGDIDRNLVEVGLRANF